MSKTPFLLNNKETVIGLSLMTGVALLFFINAIIVIIALVNVYGYKKPLPKESTIDATVFSQALKFIQPQ